MDKQIFYSDFYEPSLSEQKGKLFPLMVVCCNGEEFLSYKDFFTNTLQSSHPCYVMFIDASVQKVISPSLFENIRGEDIPYAIDPYSWHFFGSHEGSTLGWDFLNRAPRSFASAVMIGGKADPFAIRSLRYLPIRIYGDSMECDRAVYSLRSEGSTVCTRCSHSEKMEDVVTDELLDWVFSQNKNKQLAVRFIKPGLWNIESGTIDSFYLVEGKDKAAVIDTGMSACPIMPLLRNLTKLPIEAVITHGHYDHMMRIDEFPKSYMSKEDLEFFPVMLEQFGLQNNFAMEKIQIIGEGDILNFGGGVSLRVFQAFGHSPGALVFVDDFHECIFSGDAFGSGQGVLFALPGGASVSSYLKELKNFWNATEDIRGYTIYGGHSIQETEWEQLTSDYHPIHFGVIKDMITLCEKLLSGDEKLEFIPYHHWDGPLGPAFKVSHESACIWLAKSQIV